MKELRLAHKIVRSVILQSNALLHDPDFVRNDVGGVNFGNDIVP